MLPRCKVQKHPCGKSCDYFMLFVMAVDIDKDESIVVFEALTAAKTDIQKPFWQAQCLAS
jgi:hypothetical protein